MDANQDFDFDAFISHSSLDKTMANAVCAKLEMAGIRCWIAPRDVRSGGSWPGQIVEAIRRCKVMVLIFSSNSNSSAPVLNEVVQAADRKVPIVPMRIEAVDLSADLSFFMKTVHWLDAMTDPVERHLDALVLTVQRCLPDKPGQAASRSAAGATRVRQEPISTPEGEGLTIVLVEDDYQQSDDYIATLKKNISGAKIRLFESAADLIRALPELERDVPAFIISDLMMPWDDPNNEDSKVPKGYSFKTGGFFLVNRLQKSKALASVPVILWSAVDCRDEVSHLSHVKLLLKSQMQSIDMVRHVRSVLMASGALRPAKRPGSSGVAGGNEARPSPIGTSIKPKKVLKSTTRRNGRKA